MRDDRGLPVEWRKSAKDVVPASIEVHAGVPASRLMPGTGACALPDAIELTKHAVTAGCGGVLMLPQEVIRRKRDGMVLAREDVRKFIAGLTDGSVSEGQVAAFAMAVFFKGMSREEAVGLRWIEIDFDGSCLRLSETKTGRSTRPLGKAALADTSKGGASDAIIRKYRVCMNEKMDNNESQSITQWEKTHVEERKACDKASGWK